LDFPADKLTIVTFVEKLSTLQSREILAEIEKFDKYNKTSRRKKGDNESEEERMEREVKFHENSSSPKGQNKY
jgi:hypothetical protein